MSRKSTIKTEIAARGVPGGAQHLALFGPPPLIDGEDAAAYDQLLARICAAVKPVDIIDEMFIADVVHSEWEVLRLPRLKWSLIRAPALEALENFLGKNLGYDLYSQYFADALTEILQHLYVPEDQVNSVQTLAHECAQNEAEAVNKVQKILYRGVRSMKQVLDDAKDRKAKELGQGYARREPSAVTLLHELLAAAGVSMDRFMANALVQKLDDIERIYR